MRRLILCADDFGMSREISETIAALAADNKLNATSCMSIHPGWAVDAALLEPLSDRMQIGLHLTFTDERPLTPMTGTSPDGKLLGIDPLIFNAISGRLALEEIKAEVAAQFARFVRYAGRAPDFVDGHQHAHLLPGIRSIVLDATALWAPQAWVRNCYDHWSAIAARPFRAKAVEGWLFSLGLARAARRRGLRCNDSFAGYYAFEGDYAAVFPTFLAKAGTAHLVMCHPGEGFIAGDRIAAARVVEAEALRAMQVADLAAAHGLAFPL